MSRRTIATSTKNILLIEDDLELAQLVEARLVSEGYGFAHARDGVSGLERGLREKFDLVILDLGLPGMRGLDVCRELRKASEQLPILMLTSASDEVTKVIGFELGTDDYLTKPFSYYELVLRIRALLRRAGGSSLDPASPTETMTIGTMVIDLAQRTVCVEGEAIELTALEFDLLDFFAKNLNRALSYDDLIHHVWGNAVGQEQTVRAQVSRLRKKLNPEETPNDFIQTVRGFGYKMINPKEFSPSTPDDE